VADLLYLSYWLRGYREANMLRWLGVALDRFPFSSVSGGISTFRIYAIEQTEPPLVDTYYDQAADVATVLDSAHEFRAADCAYLAGGFWDLWQMEQDWNLTPSPALISCYGPEFESDLGDHLRIELGLDSHFLPPEEASAGLGPIKSNIQSVLRLARELDQVLPVQKRSLWTESGENFAERLRAIGIASRLPPTNRGS
jgi:hypothetical protein